MTHNLSQKHRHMVTFGWIVCLLAACFYCYEYLLRIEPSVMVHELLKNFGVTAGSLGVLTAMYYYAYTPLQVVVGITTDYFGPKKILTIAIGFCAIGVLIFGDTQSVMIASIGRILIGIGSAFAFVGVLKLAAMWLPKNLFSIFVGLTTSLGMIGAMIGDVEMSHLVTTIGWHKVLIFSAIAGFIFLPIFWLVVRERHQQQTSETKSGKQLWQKLLEIIKDRQMWLAGSIGCLLYLSLTVFAELWGIPFLHSTHTQAGLADKLNSCVFLGWLLGSPFNGWLSNRLKSRKKPMIIGSLLACIAISIILLRPELPTVLIAILLTLFGLFSSAEILSFVIARERAGQGVTATAVGFINLVVMLGGAIFQPLAGHLIDLSWNGARGAHGVPIYSLHDYQFALWLIPACMLISFVISFFLQETYSAHS